MLRAGFGGGTDAEELVFGQRRGINTAKLGLALGDGSRLIEHHGVGKGHGLKRLAAFIQYAKLRAASRADHDRRRRCKAKRARAGHDEDGDEDIEHELDILAAQRPDDCGEHRNGHDDGHKYSRDLVGKLCDRRFLALSILHHADYLRKGGVAADLSRREHYKSLAVYAAAGDAAADIERDGQALTGEHAQISA